MNKKILVVGLACMSAVAMAQSSGDQSSEKKKSTDAALHEVKAPRDLSTGMASGKQATPAAQPAKADAKTSAADDWNQAKNKGGKPNSASWDLATSKGARSAAPQGSDANGVHVAAGDVNGDGKADVKTPTNPAPVKGQNPPADKSKVQAPKDVATGQASGKRQ